MSRRNFELQSGLVIDFDVGYSESKSLVGFSICNSPALKVKQIGHDPDHWV